MVLRAFAYWCEGTSQPVLTVEDLSSIVGVLFPRLETLGLEVPWRGTPSHAERNCSVASFILRTLLVGTRALFGQESSDVASFLKDRFPGLQYLYRFRLWDCENDGWQPVMTANGYSGGYYGPGMV